MEPWRFVDYWPRDGFNPIRIWESGHDEDVLTAFGAVLDALSQEPDWLDDGVKKLFRPLEREEKGLGEIIFATRYKRPGAERFSDRNFRVFVQLRILKHDCVLFVGSEKQRGTYAPPNAPRIAFDYLARLNRNEGFTDGHI